MENTTRFTSFLQLFFETDKPRVFECFTPFGYIVFSEINGNNEKIYFIIKMSSWEFLEDIRPEVCYFSDATEFEKFMKDQNAFLAYHHNIYGGDTVAFVQKELGALKENEIYFIENNYHMNPEPKNHIFKVSSEKYMALIEKCIHEKPLDFEHIFEYAGNISENNKKLVVYQEHTFDFINARSYANWGNRDPRTSSNDNTWFNENVKDLIDLNYLKITNNHSLLEEGLSAIHKLSQLVGLDLNDNCLTELPAGLDQLQYLKRITVKHNNLTSLEGFIGLSHLEILDLTDNHISEIPKEILQLKNLKKLNLSKNPLKEIPSWIGEMTFLEELILTQTQLQNLPVEITHLKQLKVLGLKKNPFRSLPKEMLEINKKSLDLEERNIALYDQKTKLKLSKLPTGTISKFEDFHFKLMVVQHLMYTDEVLIPKFDVHEFAENYTKRKIDLDIMAYEIIPEVKEYFENLEIPMPLLWDIKELEANGGDEIFHQLIPHWDGEDDNFKVISAKDAVYLPYLKKVTLLHKEKNVVKALREMKIKVGN